MNDNERLEVGKKFAVFTRSAKAGFPDSFLAMAPAGYELRSAWLIQVLQFLFEDTRINPLEAYSLQDLSRRIDELPNSAERVRELLQLVNDHFRESGNRPEKAEPIDERALPQITGLRWVKLLGSGAIGKVYEAVQSFDGVHRNVAVKLIPKDSNSDKFEQEQIARFRREYKILRQLKHPNLIPVFDFGETASFLYYTMQVLRGGTLRDRRSVYVNQPWETIRYSFLNLMKKICSAVSYANENGIVHRDLKPGNIVFDEHDEPHICDFGIAKELDELTIGQEPRVMGTPDYLSPESELSPGQSDVRSDVYSLGAIMANLLLGDGAVRLPAASWQTRGIPAELVRVIQCCLKRSPDERFQTVGELSECVQAIEAGEEVRIPESQGSSRNRIQGKRNVVFWRLATCVAVLITVSMLSKGYWWQKASASIDQTAISDTNGTLNDYDSAIQVLEAMLRSMQNRFNQISDADRRESLTELNEIVSRFNARSPDNQFLKLTKAKIFRLVSELEYEMDSVTDDTRKRLKEASAILEGIGQDDALALPLKTELNLNEFASALVDVTLGNRNSGQARLELLATSLENDLGGKPNPAMALLASRLYLSLANSATSRQEYTKAAGLLRKAKEWRDRLSPETDVDNNRFQLEFLTELAANSFRSGNLQEADEILSRANSEMKLLDPRSVLAYYFEGIILNLRGATSIMRAEVSPTPDRELENAEKFLKEAIDRRRRLVNRQPDRVDLAKELQDSTTNLGIVYQKTGNSEKARELVESGFDFYRKLSADNPSSFDAQLSYFDGKYQLAKFEYEFGNSEVALELLTNSISELSELNNEFQNLIELRLGRHWAVKAEVLMKLKRWNQAVDAWGFAIKFCERSTEHTYVLSRSYCLAVLNDFDAAIHGFDRVSGKLSSADDLHNLAVGYLICIGNNQNTSRSDRESLFQKIISTVERFPVERDRTEFLAKKDLHALYSRYPELDPASNGID